VVESTGNTGNTACKTLKIKGLKIKYFVLTIINVKNLVSPLIVANFATSNNN
jgi:hypothetical protein